MDYTQVPHKVSTKIVTYEGDWTAEEIDNGLAGEPKAIEVFDEWYEPSADGPVRVTDPTRIEELEARVDQ